MFVLFKRLFSPLSTFVFLFYSVFVNVFRFYTKGVVIVALISATSPGTPVSFTNKTNSHDITEILLKVALNTITLPNLM